MGVDGAVMTKSTSNPVVIERNKIQPMSAFTYEGSINMSAGLAYTTNDGYPLDPMTFDGFGVDFIDNLYDENTGRGMLLFEDDVTAIPAKAFLECTNLTWMRLPEGITSIGDSAFQGCSKLVSVSLGTSIKTIGNSAFRECVKLTGVVIPNNVTTIGSYVFYNCDALTEMIIPSQVTAINEYAFYDCDNLQSITIGKRVTTVGQYAFFSCDKLADVSIGSGVTEIHYRAFQYCKSLTTITIPSKVKSISDRTFEECSALKEVYCKPTTPPTLGRTKTVNGDVYYYSSSVFSNNASGRKIYVPVGSGSAYKNANIWRDYYKSDIVETTF
jgi:hypothetical protein